MRYGVPRETSLYKRRVTDKFLFPSLGLDIEGEIWLLCALVRVLSVLIGCHLEVDPIPDFVAVRAVKRRTGSERSVHEFLVALPRRYRGTACNPRRRGHLWTPRIR